MSKWKQILYNKKGSSLVVVIVVFAVVMILGTSILSVVSHSYQNSADTHKQQQAYYTARSAMDTVLNTLSNTSTCAKLSSKLQASLGVTQTASGTIPGMGDYQVDLTHNSTTKKVKVEVTGTFQRQTCKLYATLKEGRGSRMNPMDFMFFNKSGGVTGLSGSGAQVTINGNVYAKTSASPENLILTGNYMTFGSFVLGQNSKITGNLYVNGAVEVSDPTCEVKGNLYTTMIPDPLDPDKVSKVTGTKMLSMDVPDDDTLPVTEGLGFLARLEQRQKPWNKSFITVGGVAGLKIDGYIDSMLFGLSSEYFKLYDETYIMFNGFNIFTTRNNGAFSMSGTNFDCGFGIKANVPAKKVTFPDGAVLDLTAKTFTVGNDEKKAVFHMTTNMVTEYINGVASSPVNLGDVILSNNGTVKRKPSTYAMLDSIDPSKMNITTDSILPSGSYNNKTITIDATTQDIIVTTNGDLSLDNTKIQIKGNKKVYLFFNDNKNITVKNNCVLGINSDTTTALNQFYVVGEGLTMALGGNSVFMGTAYMNNGSYGEIVSGLTPATGIVKVQGSITADSITITKGNTYQYIDTIDPMYDATLPVNYFIYPRLAADEINWKIEKYGK